MCSYPMRLGELSAREQAELLEWILSLPKTRRGERGHTAYALKQPFSRLHFYVTKEVFTEAMVSAGIKPDARGLFAVRFHGPGLVGCLTGPRLVALEA